MPARRPVPLEGRRQTVRGRAATRGARRRARDGPRHAEGAGKASRGVRGVCFSRRERRVRRGCFSRRERRERRGGTGSLLPRARGGAGVSPAADRAGTRCSFQSFNRFDHFNLFNPSTPRIGAADPRSARRPKGRRHRCASRGVRGGGRGAGARGRGRRIRPQGPFAELRPRLAPARRRGPRDRDGAGTVGRAGRGALPLGGTGRRGPLFKRPLTFFRLSIPRGGAGEGGKT